MLQRASDSSSARPEKMFSCTSRRSRWKDISLSTKVRQWNLKSRRAPRVFRLRTLQASSLSRSASDRFGGFFSKIFESSLLASSVKEVVVQVMQVGQTIIHHMYVLD